MCGPMNEKREAVIGVVTASDRASAGIYEDESGPAIAAYLQKALTSPFRIERRIIPDGFESVRDTLIDLADNIGCDLIVTTGGTGPAPRDLTPEATLAAAPRELPGFGELMRKVSLAQTPTAILSRQIGRPSGQVPRHQPARQAGGDRALPRRGDARRALLSRSHRRGLYRNRPGAGRGVPPQGQVTPLSHRSRSLFTERPGVSASRGPVRPGRLLIRGRGLYRTLPDRP